MTMLLLDHARETGLTMGSIGSPGQGSRHIGWTTDAGLVEKLREAGAFAIAGYGVESTRTTREELPEWA